MQVALAGDDVLNQVTNLPESGPSVIANLLAVVCLPVFPCWVCCACTTVDTGFSLILKSYGRYYRTITEPGRTTAAPGYT